MKKFSGFVLLAAVALALGGCVSKPEGTTDIPELNEISGYTQEQLEEKLIGLLQEEMHDSWGDPDGMLSGLWGDIWHLRDENKQQIILYYDKDGAVEHIICSLSDENIDSNEVCWEYTPAMSSRYPAMPFSFSASYQRVMAACNNGTLIDYDHFDLANGSYPQGKSITVQDTETLYWAPWGEEENTVAASAEVTFTVWGKDDAVLYEGTLAIVQVEKTECGAIYSATLKEGSGLILMQDEYQLGGILTPLPNE